jgi:hypothetical protein
MSSGCGWDHDNSCPRQMSAPTEIKIFTEKFDAGFKTIQLAKKVSAD